jgi:hypothetical protein
LAMLASSHCSYLLTFARGGQHCTLPTGTGFGVKHHVREWMKVSEGSDARYSLANILGSWIAAAVPVAVLNRFR